MTAPRKPSAPDAALPPSVPALDGVRGLAALMVVLTHVGYQTGAVVHGAHGALLARFDVGVALFFVLSGFLLYRPWLAAAAVGRRAPDVRSYLRRRGVRILPAYWLVLIVVLLLPARSTLTSADTLTNLTLTQVYPGHLLPDYTQTWSLCTEAAFYVLLPLVAGLLARHRRRRIAWVALLAVVVGAWAWTGLCAADVLPVRAAQWLPGHADWFVAGLVLATLADDVHRRPEGRVGRLWRDFREAPGALLALAAGVAVLAATPLAGPRTLAVTTTGDAVTKEVLYAVAATLLVLAALVAGPRTRFARLLGSRPARWCGHVSYGVFLWHLLVLDAVRKVLGVPLFGGHALTVGLLTVIGSLAAAGLSWQLFERPLLERWSRPVSASRPAEPDSRVEPGAEHDQQATESRPLGRPTT
jgi:peptidoglycan/LPS O-acetylase OafA/YrhL